MTVMRMSTKKTLAELSRAVAKVREASRLSQDGLARALGVATMSISRWERGQQAPSDFHVLNRLHGMARDAGLAREADLFDEARAKLRFNAYKTPETLAEPTALPVWRLAVALRLAAVYFPDTLCEVEKALNRPLEIVDSVLRSTDELDFRRLEREVFALAQNKTLELLKRIPTTTDDQEVS